MTSLDPDYQFINVQIHHNTQFGNEPSPASAQVIRNTAILKKMENFYVSIGRMTFPSFSLPLFCAALQPGTDYSLNQMVYTFTLTYNEFTSETTPVPFISDNTIHAPNTGIVESSLQTSNPYYYIYSFWSICNMFNQALETAYNDLIVKTGGIPGSAPAKFYYDFLNEQIVLTCNNTYGIGAGFININYNNILAPLLSGFDSKKIAGNSANGIDNTLIIVDNMNNFANSIYTIRPIYFDASYYSPVGTLQLNTSILINQETVQPAVGSFIVKTIRQNDGHQLNPTSSILTDFIPDFTQISSLNSVYIYNKVDDYRYADIISQGALTSFNISLIWTDKAGREIPLLLYPGTLATIKIGFFKKGLGLHPTPAFASSRLHS